MMCELIGQINNFFVERHIFLNEEWLKNAIEYVCSITGEDHVSANIVYELWKFSDIKESTQPCISEDIKNAKNFTGNLVLQIQSILDIGTSYLNQFKKLVYVATDNAEFLIKDQNDEKSKDEGSRLFQLILTDGVSSIKAVEYIRVEQLSLLICPGSKILLHGNLKARRGVFLLIPDNCQLLGGDVETLMKTNRPVEIMSCKLKIPLLPSVKASCALPQSNRSSLIPQQNINVDQSNLSLTGLSVPVSVPTCSSFSLHQSTLCRTISPESITAAESHVDRNVSQTSVLHNTTARQKNKFSTLLQTDQSKSAVDLENSAPSITNKCTLLQNSSRQSIQKASVIQEKTEYSKVDYNLHSKCSDLSLSHNIDDSTFSDQNFELQSHSNLSYGFTSNDSSNFRNNKNTNAAAQSGDNGQKLSALLDKMNDIANKLDAFIKMASSFYKK